LSNRELKHTQRQRSTLELESPIDLYWLHRQEGGYTQASEAERPEGDRTILGEEFWDEFSIVCKAVLLRNREATLYDAFNFMREHLLGGWTIIEDSKFIEDIDAKIEREYQEEVRQGKWKN